MQTANERIYDSILRHQILTINYSNAIAKDAAKLFVNTEEALEKELLFQATKLSTLTKGTKAYVERTKIARRAIAKIRFPVWETLSKTLAEEMLEFAQDEVEFLANTISNAIPLAKPLEMTRPDRSVVKERLKNSVVAEGLILTDVLEKMKQNDTERMATALVNNLVDDVTPADAVKAITGTASQKYKDGIMRKAANGFASIAATITPVASNTASTALYQRNSYLIQKEIYRSVLDSGTTPRCMELSNNVYDVGVGPAPPQHYRCRSVRIAEILSDDLESRAFDPSTEKTLLSAYVKENNLDPSIKKPADLPRGTKTDFRTFARKRRRELIGKAPVKVSYSDFLSKQSAEFQREVLGNARYKAFKKSGEPIGKFINRGKFLTLAQLRNKGLA